MIGVDTNVVVRLFVNDDPAQTAEAHRVVSEAEARDERMFINHVVLAELVWVLVRSKKFGRDAIVQTIDALLSSKLFVVDEAETVAAALVDFVEGAADFADCLIARRNLAAGCAATITFDKLARRHKGFRAP